MTIVSTMLQWIGFTSLWPVFLLFVCVVGTFYVFGAFLNSGVPANGGNTPRARVRRFLMFWFMSLVTLLILLAFYKIIF